MEEMGRSKAEGMLKVPQEMTQTSETKSDITPPNEGTIVASKERAQTKVEDTQKGTEEQIQTIEEKPDTTPPNRKQP